jgi:hypothetical protein
MSEPRRFVQSFMQSNVSFTNQIDDSLSVQAGWLPAKVSCVIAC